MYQAPRPLWRRLLPGISLLCVVALIGTLYLVRSGNRPSFGVGADGLGNAGQVEHTVYLDGWTLRTLQGKPIRFQSGVVGTEGFTDPLALTFSPLDAGELGDLVKSDPEIVEEAVSRLVTGDSSLRCRADGCRTGGVDMDASVLTDLGAVPGLGSLYQAWNITAGLHRATFRAPEGAPIVLSVEDAGALTLFDTPEKRTVIGEDGTEITLSSPPSGETGWGRRSWYVAVAWGTVFIPQTLWNDEVPAINDRGAGDSAAVENPNTALPDPALLARGLSDLPSQSLAALSSSQLTYFSSPVTGCGVAALCVPDSVIVKVQESSRQVQPVCSVDGGYATAVALTTDWQVTLIGQTHAFGAWNGKDPQNFPGATGTSVLGYRGAPELVGGQLDLRVNLWMLVNSNGEIFAIAGSRGQIGVDDAVYTKAKATLAELPQFFEGDWSACKR